MECVQKADVAMTNKKKTLFGGVFLMYCTRYVLQLAAAVWEKKTNSGGHTERANPLLSKKFETEEN